MKTYAHRTGGPGDKRILDARCYKGSPINGEDQGQLHP